MILFALKFDILKHKPSFKMETVNLRFSRKNFTERIMNNNKV